MTSRLVAVAFDANEPVRLARFWAGALRWKIADGATDRQADGVVALVPTDDTPLRIVFRPSAQKKAAKNAIHFDLTTTSIDDQRGTVARLIDAGARHIDVGQRADEPHVVLADPEGNELCIIEPTNSFLAGCGRLGSITCDGSRAVGYFWSAALGWPLVWDQDEETAIRAPDGTGPFITWGPPVPVKGAGNRLHLEIAPEATPDATLAATADRGDETREVDRLVALGATHVDSGRGAGLGITMADPDGNEFLVRLPR